MAKYQRAQDSVKDLGMSSWCQGCWWGFGHSLLWTHFLGHVCVKHLVNAVSRLVPSLSYLLTKLLPPSPSRVKILEPSQYKSLGDLSLPTFPASRPHLPLRTLDTLFFLFLKRFLLCPTSGPLHILCLELLSPTEFLLFFRTSFKCLFLEAFLEL